jgi:hypothetical protein
MTTRHILATSIAALALAAAPALHASPVAINSPVHAMFTKAKTVQISFRNDSGTPLELKIGESVMKVDTGKTLSLKLPEGTRVITNTATPKLEAGALIAQVAAYLSGATVSIK